MRNIICLFALVLAVTACSHNLREEFDMSMSKYNDLLIRNELGPASIFTSNSIKTAFIARAEELKDIRIIDYRIVNAKYDEPNHKAEVTVDISYYNLYFNKVRSIRDIQEWKYSEENGIKGWRITSVLPKFQ